MAVVRPLRELDLDDEPRLDPDDLVLADARQLQRHRKRRVLALQRLQQPDEPLDLLLVEPGADVADVGQLAAAPDGEDQRAKTAGAAATALRVPRDEELLPAVRLDLHPVAGAPALEVARLDALADDPLEALLLRRLQERGAVVERLREA